MKKILFFCLILVLSLSGCSKKTPYEQVNSAVAVDGIYLGEEEKALPEYLLNGEKDNCVYGYELRSQDPEVTIGISGERHTLRKIITAVKEHSIYGVSPGDDLASAEKAMLDSGFQQEDSSHKYTRDDIRIELLSADNTLADRIAIEIIEK